MQKYLHNNHIKGVILVCIAATFWSFGSLIVRHMVEAQSYRWQYLFFRGLTIAAILFIYLITREGVAVAEKFKQIGLSGFIGACGLVTAFGGFIWSITLTTVANTLFMWASVPFISAFLGILVLQEKIRGFTWAAMALALAGMLVMVMEGLQADRLAGNLIGLASAVGFAVFAVSLRRRKETPQFATVILAGVLCALIAMAILFFQNNMLAMPLRNIYLSMLHGFIVGVGLILFSHSAKYLPAAELTLLTQIEVVGGVFWVYLPVLGIHEVPSTLTVIGGSILLVAILINGFDIRHKPQEGVMLTERCS